MSVFLVAVVIVMVMSCTRVRGLRLEMGGYEDCVFHILDENWGRSQVSIDIVEQILVAHQGQVPLQWSVTTLSPPPPPVDDFDPLLLPAILPTPMQFREQCSVNIVVQMEGPFLTFLTPIFGSRLHETKNIFILLLGTKEDCVGELRGQFDTLIQVDIFRIHVVPKSSGPVVQFATSLCSVCPQNYRSNTIPLVKLYSLSRMLDFSNRIRDIAILPEILGLGTYTKGFRTFQIRPCSFLYTRRQGTRPDMIGCEPEYVAIENIAAALNSSFVRPIETEGEIIMMHRFGMGPYVRAIAFMDVFPNWIQWLPEIPADQVIHQMLRAENKQEFIYCVKQEERENFKFHFWALAFDSWSWAYICAMTLTLTILLKGAWFEVVAVLMRQSCSVLEHRRILILFILVTIVLTYGYEGVISSFIMAPSPVVVLKNLRDLISNNYAMIGSKGYDKVSRNLKFLFDKNNVSEAEQKAFIIPDTHELSLERTVQFMRHSNVTMLTRADETMFALTGFSHRFGGGSKCHAVQESCSGIDLYHFGGPSRNKLGHLSRSLMESGILGMYYDYTLFVRTGRAKQKMARDAYNENLPLAFQLKQWRILSIFLGWAVLACISLSALSAELLYDPRFLNIIEYILTMQVYSLIHIFLILVSMLKWVNLRHYFVRLLAVMTCTAVCLYNWYIAIKRLTVDSAKCHSLLF